MIWQQQEWLDSDYCFVLALLNDYSHCERGRTWNEVGWAIIKAMWDEIAAALLVVGWQPIATAPKDRTILLKICQRELLTLFPSLAPGYITVGCWSVVKNLAGEIIGTGWGDGLLFRGEAIEWHELPPGS